MESRSNKTLFAVVLLLTMCFSMESFAQTWETKDTGVNLNFSDHDNAIKWYKSARFGVFVHWSASVDFDPISSFAQDLESARNGENTAYYRDGGNMPCPYRNVKRARKFKMFEGYQSIPSYLRWDYKNNQDTGNTWWSPGIDRTEFVLSETVHWTTWNPTLFDADEWVDTFLDAGAQYITFTAWDFYGFANFDDPSSGFDVMETTYGKDICEQLAQAAKDKIPIMWYQLQDSTIDHTYGMWPYINSLYNDWDDYFRDVRRKGLYELISNTDKYGKTVGIWFDGDAGGTLNSDHPWREEYGKYLYHNDQENSPYLGDLLAHQPWMIFSKRFGMPNDPNNSKDIIPVEISDMPLMCTKQNKSWTWEMQQSLEADQKYWAGGRDQDTKTAEECIKLLISAASRGSNFSLIVNPRADGSIEQNQKDTLQGIGDWLRLYGDTIYGTWGGPYHPGPWGGATRKGNKIYLHIMQVSHDGEYTFPKLPDGDRIVSVKLINAGADENVEWSNDETDNESGFAINFNDTIAREWSVVDRIVEVTYDDTYNTLDIPYNNASIYAQTGFPESLAKGATVTATSVSESYHGHPFFANQRPVDVIVNSKRIGEGKYWSASEPFDIDGMANGNIIVNIDLGEPKTFQQLSLYEKHNRITSWKVQYYSESAGRWKNVIQGKGKRMGMLDIRKKKPITAQKLRIVIWKHHAEGAPQLRYFRLYQ